MKHGILLGFGMVLAGLAGAGAAEAQASDARDVEALREAAQGRERRIIFDNDGNEPVYRVKEATREDLLSHRTAPLAGTQVDTIMYCTWSSGFGVFTHATDVGERFTVKEGFFEDNMTGALLDAGLDPLQVMVDFARENDIEIFWTMRMNDIHDAWNAEYSPYLFPQLKQDHPEWLVGAEGADMVNGKWTAVDFAHPEIRDLAFRFHEEVLENYDVDGVQFDFFRHPIFFKSHAEGRRATQEECDMMTDLIRRVRQRADAIAAETGKAKLVSVRVPDSTAYCRAIGLDVEQWLKEDLIDMLAVSCYFRLQPWESSVALGHHYGVPVYPSLSESRVRDAFAKKLRAGLPSYRARAANAWYAGVDGIYMFNYFNPNTPHWQELGSPETLRGLDKMYTTGARGQGNLAGLWMEGGEQYRTRELLSPDYPREIAAGGLETAPLRVAEQDGGERMNVLAVRVDPQPEAARIAVRWNDMLLPEAGRDEHGIYFELDTGQIIHGDNLVTVENHADAAMAWRDVWLEVDYEPYNNPLREK